MYLDKNIESFSPLVIKEIVETDHKERSEFSIIQILS